MEDKMIEIHIAKRYAFCAYRKEKKLKSWSDSEINGLVDKYMNNCFGFIIYKYNGMFISLKNCFNKKHCKDYNKKNGYQQLVSAISHESIEMELYRKFGLNVAKSWDYVAEKLTREGYL
jgi:hypothetical protein